MGWRIDVRCFGTAAKKELWRIIFRLDGGVREALDSRFAQTKPALRADTVASRVPICC